MKVFKFGGASVKNADGVRNLAHILKLDATDKIVVVISAMGKTTNALESLLSKAIDGENTDHDFDQLKTYHLNIAKELFSQNHLVFDNISQHFKDLHHKLAQANKEQYDFHYDQIVSKGELLSTLIVESYLKQIGFNSLWLDAGDYIATDSTFRSAKVHMEESEMKIKEISNLSESVFVTQGFIGSNHQKAITTLGREGSDYSAALFAYALKTEEVTIWKDVDGVYNADPKIFSYPKLIEQLSYKETIELAFYGASVIHPKTIQPLSERNIKLKVKSFYQPELPGTLVSNKKINRRKITSVIVKKNQLLISLVPRNLSFTDLPNMSKAMGIIAQHRHQVNITQNSAISFSVCLDSNVYHFNKLISDLNQYFIVKYNRDLVLVTIRNYPTELIDTIYEKTQFKLEQRNRSTYQILVDYNEFNDVLFPLIDSH